jgi:hypothetical protein
MSVLKSSHSPHRHAETAESTWIMILILLGVSGLALLNLALKVGG